MGFCKLTKTLAIGLAAVPLAVGAAGAMDTLRVQSSFNSGDIAYKYLNEKWVPELEKMTADTLTMQIMPNGSVVPHRETPEAVALGVLDGDLTAIAYFTGRNPAFAILGDLIAGYDNPQQTQGFCRDGGGEDALQETWNKVLPDKVHVVGCGPYTREALVAAVPIRGVEDLKGIKIRSPEGLAADVFRRAGATPVNIPFSEVYTALQQGIVQAADASAYMNNDANGMHKIAAYPLFPGIHSQATMQFTISQKKWDTLTADQRKAVDEWFYKAWDDLREYSQEQDLEIVARDKKNPKIEVIDWPQPDRDKFRAIAMEAWKAFAEKSPEARKALDAHLAYMKKTGLVK